MVVMELLLWVFAFVNRAHHLALSQSIVEGFQGDNVSLPCTLHVTGVLEWRPMQANRGLILIKLPKGIVFRNGSSSWAEVASVDGDNSLRITGLNAARDNGQLFRCRDSYTGHQQVTRVTVLARITETEINEAMNGELAVIEGITTVVTCLVSGNPYPPPSYNWTIGEDKAIGQDAEYALTAERSMTGQRVKCSATNTYSNGTILSSEEDAAVLEVLYLDIPKVAHQNFSVIQSNRITFQCTTQGNPQPILAWQRSDSAEILGSSASYTLENVTRSDAGEYICNVSNALGSRHRSSFLRVMYPPDVSVAYNRSTRTLICTSQGVPDLHRYSPWEHYLDGTLIRTLGAPACGMSSSYTFPNPLIFEDTGTYVCSVTNGIKPLQKGQVSVIPTTAAVFGPHLEVYTIESGKAETISIPFYAQSSSGKALVVWRRSGQSRPLVCHRELDGYVSLVVFGKNVRVRGTVTVLTLSHVTVADSGNYTTTVITDINGVTMRSHVTFFVRVSDSFAPFPLGSVIGGAAGATVLMILTSLGLAHWCVQKRRRTAPDPTC